MPGSCKECHCLWAAHAEATLSHVKGVNRQQIAVKEHNAAALAILDPLVLEAGALRTTTLQALRDHERAAHSVNWPAVPRVALLVGSSMFDELVSRVLPFIVGPF